MPSDQKNKEDTEEKQNRVTVTLDKFDRIVISKMAAYRNTSLSRIMQNMAHTWIEENPEVLKTNYGIDVREISERLAMETTSILLDKTMKSYEKAIINELPQFFELVDDVSIEDLAEQFDVSEKAIKNIIFIHGKEIKQVGLTLKYKENRIYKE
ncbi:MAG: hypothetical protein ACXAAH_07380 [Promethearchaeota archaeon]|jgi:hypothetical protein